MKKKLRLNDQSRLKIICDHVCDDIESLLSYFNLDYKYNNNRMISMCCPIHGGDNISAVNIYTQGESYRGNWKCRTHGCEKTFQGSIIGFIRGVISSQKYNWQQPQDEICPFQEALDFALSFTNQDLSNIKICKIATEKKQFAITIKHLSNPEVAAPLQVTRKQIVRALDIPAVYYQERGYSKELLIKYDIGLCDKPGKEMEDRVVVPIYNNDYTHMVGCTGRSRYEKCETCSAYHNLSNPCPDESKKYLFSKWRHSKDFKSQNHLYNLWFSKASILQTGVAIIVESPGNVWRLEDNGIHNSVAMFGSSLSDRQKILLDSSGAMSLVILTDNDEAGQKAAKQITAKCENTYRIFIPTISKGDIGEMSSSEVKEEIQNYLENIK